MKAEIVFADEKLRQAFDRLKDSKTEDIQLYDLLKRAFEDIENDPSGFTHVPRNLIPKEYVQKYNVKNLWKYSESKAFWNLRKLYIFCRYNLPNAWRLLYSLTKDRVLLLAIILEWLDHKNYERRFGY